MLTSVLFDLDGTLLDTVDDFMAIIDAMLQEHGKPMANPALVRSQVSNGSVGMLCAAFAMRPDGAGFDDLREDFLRRYTQQLAVHTRPFPGIMDLLDWLDAEGLPWGVVTNKMSRFSIPLIEAMGLAERCGSLICPDQVTHGKPHAEPVLKACAELGVEPGDCVFVGDHLRDIQSGNAAGTATVAALYGYIPAGDDPASWQATHSINNATELRSWLEARRVKETLHV
ncbi:HAD-IA family hydrolase [Pseudomonas neustonica]|uniref:HAD-IA family hydrolase n=1 Tax=Pseudomonas neustonica TaxID=2487346 RepID=UPI003F46B8E3